MNTNFWWIPIITVVLGAIAGGLAGLFSPIVQATLEQRRRLDEIYRTNKGNQIYTLYFPLLEILKKLEVALDNANAKFEFHQSFDQEDEDEYREELLNLIAEIPKLLEQGKDAYLTTKLAEHLKSFQKFMQDSMELEENQYHPKYDTALVLIHTPFGTQKKTLHTKRDSDSKEIWDIYSHAKKKKKEIDNIIYAPVISSLFDLRFIHDIHEMKALIREVVQYSPHSPSPPQNL